MSLTTLLLATIYYAGVVGPRTSGIERQLGEILTREVGAETIVLDESLRRSMALRQRPARKEVRALGGEALVIGRLRTGSSFVLQTVLYDRSGQVRGRFDIPLGQASLDAAAEERIRNELVARVREIAPVEPKAAPVAAAPASAPAPDTETPPGLGTPPAPAAPAPPAPAAEPVVMVARTRDPGGVLPGLTTEASMGIDFVSRTFTPEPRAIPAYQINSVPALRLAGNVQPVSWLAFAFALDRVVGLDSKLEGQPVPTTLSSWQLRANVMARRTGWSVGGSIGYGQRTFAIESKSPARSPDGDYGHLIVGLRGRADLGRFSLIGEMAYEPVVSGEESTMGAYGNAQRWGIEATAGVQCQVWSFLLLGAHAGYQRFAWDWPSRGLGGAVDDYLTFGLSAGVRLVPVQ